MRKLTGNRRGDVIMTLPGGPFNILVTLVVDTGTKSTLNGLLLLFNNCCVVG